jgi:hypothetical protein
MQLGRAAAERSKYAHNMVAAARNAWFAANCGRNQHQNLCYINQMQHLLKEGNKAGDRLCRENTAMKQGYLFASAIVGGLVATAIAGKPAAADTCLTQPNLRAEGGRWQYRIDRLTQRKCWYQRTSRTEARVSPPASSDKLAAQSRAPLAQPSGLNSWQSQAIAARSRDVRVVAERTEEVQDQTSARPAREFSSRWRPRTVRRGQAAVLRAAREDQDSFRVQSRGSTNARARVIEAPRVETPTQENSTVGRPDPGGRAAVNDQEDARTRGINPDNGRATPVDPNDSPLNRFDWDAASVRSASSTVRGDRLLLPKAVSTVTEPSNLQAPPQMSVPGPVKTGVSALDAAAREALFQEFLRWQARRQSRYW